jgi:hypothetical protein
MDTILGEVLTGFTPAEWNSCPDTLPKQPGSHVYVFVVEMGNLFFPLYVGQTNRLFGRFGDYQYASFQAPTDFRVGEACKFLRSQGATVHLFFRGNDEIVEGPKVNAQNPSKTSRIRPRRLMASR